MIRATFAEVAYQALYAALLRKAKDALPQERGALLACIDCQQWAPITALPHICPTCGRHYLEEEGAT